MTDGIDVNMIVQGFGGNVSDILKPEPKSDHADVHGTPSPSASPDT